MAFLSLNLNDTPGLAPRMNVLFWGPGDFPVSYSNRDTSWNAWNSHSESFIGDTGILFSNMKCPSRECWVTFWSLTNSDFPTNRSFHRFHDLDAELDLHRLWAVSVEHLQRVWHASRERLPFRTPGSVPPLWDLLVLQLLKPDSSNLPCLYSTFHLEYPLVLSRFFSQFQSILKRKISMLSNATNQPKSAVELGYMCPRGLFGPQAVTLTK